MKTKHKSLNSTTRCRTKTPQTSSPKSRAKKRQKGMYVQLGKICYSEMFPMILSFGHFLLKVTYLLTLEFTFSFQSMFSFQSIFRDPSYFSFSTISSSLLYMVEFALSNALMLAAMTFSVWFCLSIVTGYGFGYYIFHKNVQINCRNLYETCCVVALLNRLRKLIQDYPRSGRAY